MNTTNTGQEIRISVAESGDLEQILALQKIAFLSEAALIDDYSIPPLHQDIADIRDEFRRFLFLKAESGGQIVGSVRAGILDGTGLIQKLVVHPEFQNRGIGSLLLLGIEQSFPDAVRFELFTGRESIQNHVFYTRRGYRAFREMKVSDKLMLVGFEKVNGTT
jgi:GNAT superfamily N-acetyltransferase